LIHSGGAQTGPAAFYSADDAFNIGDSFDVLGTGSDAAEGTLTYARPDGEVVTATFLAEETATGCVFAGTATG
jgi:hypothetical protein